ncbi:MAG: HD domain-containing protein [Bacteroidales bacterium]|nr:HD domain-containing protein [Bacteroidales bacterium]
MNIDQLRKVEYFAKNYYDKLNPNERIWKDHIRLVRKFAQELAIIENADKDLIDVAAILHDIGKAVSHAEHSKISCSLAKEFLLNNKILENRLDLLLECILKHSSRYSDDENRVEVKILQNADALAVFFDERWQEKSKQELSKDKYQELLQKTKCKVTLDSAKKIVDKQIKTLKNS